MAPSLLWYLPRAHGVQGVASSPEYLPAGQSKHSFAFANEFFPALQFVQIVDADSAAKVFMAQVWQLDAALPLLNLPGEHPEQ